MYRSISLFILTATLAAGVFASTPSKDFRRTVPLTDDGRVELQTERGTTHITTWDRNEVDVLVHIEADEKSRDPEESVRRTQIRFSAASNTVNIATDFGERIQTWFDKDQNPRPHVSYEIRLPRGVNLQVRDNRSHIQVGKLWGHLTLETDRSFVYIADLTGTIDAHADRGQIVIGRLNLTHSSRFQTDRTAMELGLTSKSSPRLDLDLDRVSPAVEPSLLTGVTHETRHHTTYREPAKHDGPTLSIAADRGSLRLLTAN